MFADLYKYTDKELKSGIKTRLNINFLHSRNVQGMSSQDLEHIYNSHYMREVSLLQVKYKLLNKICFKEIIFTIDKADLINLAKME